MSDRLDLFPELYQAFAAKREDGLRAAVPEATAEELAAAVEEYLRRAWLAAPASRIVQVNTHDDPAVGQIAAALHARAARLLARAYVPTPEAQGPQHVVARTLFAMDRVAQFPAGIYLVGESEASAQLSTAAITAVAMDALLAAALHEAAEQGLPSIALAQLALVVDAHLRKGLAIDDALRRSVERVPGLPAPSAKTAAVAAHMTKVIAAAQAKLAQQFAEHSSLGKAMGPQHVYNPAEKRAWDAMSSTLRMVSPERFPRTHVEHPVRLAPLLQHFALARGNSESAWVEAGVDVVTMIFRAKLGTAGHSGPAVRQFLPMWTKPFEERGAIERRFANEAEQKWKEIEEEIRRERKRDPEAAGPYPLPDMLTPVESRALYYHDASARGIPLGLILNELHNDGQISFGPTEREFFQRIAFRGARGFAAEFQANVDPRVAQLTIRGNPIDMIRLEQMRAALMELECELRARHLDSDEALIALGSERLQALCNTSPFTPQHLAILQSKYDGEGRVGGIRQGIVEAMVNRIRAMDEVRFLTEWLVTESVVPAAVADDYRLLPHVQYMVHHAGPEYDRRSIRARNGQTLAELETETRARWMRYRQNASPSFDVRAIRLTGDPRELEDNPLRAKGGKPFQPPQTEPPRDQRAGGSGPRHGPSRR